MFKPRDTADMRFFELIDIGPIAFGKKYGEQYVRLKKDSGQCNPQHTDIVSPFGPRGWLDEYCEMSVMRNDSNEITRLHFTCENPEYYWQLWNVRPELVHDIYKKTIGGPGRDIRLEDLYLYNAQGDSVIDRQTGRPAYNPINKWNRGTKMTSDYGGAMHLTSGPNELSAEVVLAGGAAVLRDDTPENNIANSLIQCSEYGLIYRHSDPHIGQSAYQVLQATHLRITLLDPVGLYLQEPNYDYFTLPKGKGLPPDARIEDCFKFVRGEVSHPDKPNNLILHMVMEIPDHWPKSITLEDIQVLGRNIRFGSQVMQSIKVQLSATGIAPEKGRVPRREPCVSSNTVPAPGYFMDDNMLNASIYNGLIDSSNATPIILKVEAGASTPDIALVVENVNKKGKQRNRLTFSVPGTDIQILTTDKGDMHTPLHCFVGYRYEAEVDVPADTPPGQYSLLITDKLTKLGIPAPGMIEVVPAGSLP